MQEPNVRSHPLREIVLDALVTAQKLGEDSPAAIARAARAVMDVRPGITSGEAFRIVWDIWDV